MTGSSGHSFVPPHNCWGRRRTQVGSGYSALLGKGAKIQVVATCGNSAAKRYEAADLEVHAVSGNKVARSWRLFDLRGVCAFGWTLA